MTDNEGSISTDSTAVAPRPRRPAILMVDDDPFLLGLQARLLRAMGYGDIATAADAEAALALVQSGSDHVDVVICDLNMPGMDGIEFLQRLNGRGSRCSVVLLSGEGARILHTVQKLLGGGRLVILGALEKPAGRDALRAVLDCWSPPAAEAPAPALLKVTAADLQRAHDEDEWLLHYQPKVDLRTGDVCGVEALMRWQHPQHGLLLPDLFIGVAEDCGAIDALTDWVLRTAMRQRTQWQAAGTAVAMAVNLSMDNLRTPGFAARVGAMARAAGVAPQDMVLEITESRLMSPLPAPLESLVRLRLQRFGLSIDDFGTGHSSLAQLRDVPFTELKVDRSFVQAARHNQITRPMLEGSLGIARKLGMRSVAEGVETEDDWHLLRELGCDLAQGWFIGRPMLADRLPGWIAQWQSRCQRLLGA
jgi:EAL domain-containing protein (putative c-di-GMP-specific phosphodiesterase class I)/ActR/RegA family two-component response regulator